MKKIKYEQEIMRGKNSLTKKIIIVLVICLISTSIPTNIWNETGNNMDVQAATTLQNPRIVADSSMDAGQKVTWDCVWFGSYPQTGIVNQAKSIRAYGKEWGQDSDCEVNDSRSYNSLQNSTGWDNNEVVIGDTKYRRIKKAGTMSAKSESNRYNRNNSDTYQYFRYDKIKWRVINVSDGKAFLLADQALDYQRYNASYTNVTWRTSTIRSWLNGYGASANAYGTDYSTDSFIGSAFTSSEQGAIQTTQVVNNNKQYNGTDGGGNTNDKVFLLSESEVCTDAANNYGFVSDNYTYDEARRCKNSTYAKAKETLACNNSNYMGNCRWWLRTPGKYSYCAADVDVTGCVYSSGIDVGDEIDAVRPALILNLSSSNLWSYAGTVCSDGTVDEVAPSIDATSKKMTFDDVWGFSNADVTSEMEYMHYKKFFPLAMAGLYLMKDNGLGGLCAGMVTSSIAISMHESPPVNSFYYDNKESFNHLSDIKHVLCPCRIPYDNYTASDYVKFAYAYQYTPFTEWEEDSNKDNLDKLINAIRKYETGEEECIEISIRGLHKGKDAGHELIPMGISNDNDEKTDIVIYDCNDITEPKTLTVYKNNGKYERWEYKPLNWGTGKQYAKISFTTSGNDFARDMFSDYYDWQALDDYKLLSLKSNNIILHTDNKDYNLFNESLDEKVFPISKNSVLLDDNNNTEDGSNSTEMYWIKDSKALTFENQADDNEISIANGDTIITSTIPDKSILKTDNLDDDNKNVIIEGMQNKDSFSVELCLFESQNPKKLKLSGQSSENGKIESQLSADSASVDGADSIHIEFIGESGIKTEKDIVTNGKEVIINNENGNIIIKKDENNKGGVESNTSVVNNKDQDKKNTSNSKENTKKSGQNGEDVLKIANVSLSAISHKIVAGKKIKLNAKVLPANATNKKLKWISSNKKYATVTQSGIVKINKKGAGKTVIIKAIATDSSGKSAAWKIKVMKGAVKKVTIKGKNSVKAGKALKLIATVNVTKGKPVNKKLKWSSSNTKWATVTQSGKVMAKKAGKGKTVKITVMATDGTNKKAIRKIKIK